MENANLQTVIQLNGISAMPTFQFYKSGKLLSRFAGANIVKLREMMKNLVQIEI